MSFIPEEEIKGKNGLNLAPMIDFLFLMLMFFASLAVSRVMTRDTDIDLVEVKPEVGSSTPGGKVEYKVINVSIDAQGEYKWVTEIRDYKMLHPEDIAEELVNQHQKGLLPEDKSQTQIFLRIDKKAPWEHVLKVIFAIRDVGFEARPLYEPDDQSSHD